MNRKIEDKIKKLVEKIEESAGCITKVNSDNIQEYEIEEIEEKGVEVTEFARKMIEKYNIPLYSSPHIDFLESVVNLCKSTTTEEFLENLKKYAEEMKEWAEEEVDAFVDLFYEEAVMQAEVKESETVFFYEWDIWNGSCYVGRAHITVYKQKRELCNKEFEVYIAELYNPSAGWSSTIIDDLDTFLQELKEKIEKYEKDEYTCHELLNDIISSFFVK